MRFGALFDPVRQAREQKSGKQLGDPVKAARAMLAVISADAPPTHLLLGSDASQYVRAGMAARLAELDGWDALTQSTDG